MPVSQVLWGPTYENQLIVADPLYDLVSDREPRDGSEFIQGSSGVEDAWITGRDFTLSGEARFIPDASASTSGISGPLGWQAFLDWARDKNPFRFVPDQTNPLFYVDGCYLVDPLKGHGALGPDIKRKTPFKFRNPTVDFHQALRGVMFEYAPGASLTDPIVAAFVRASVAGILNKSGQFESFAAAALRDRHYPKGFSGSLPLPPRTTLLHSGATNKLTFPEDLSNIAWSKTGTTIPSTNNPSPRGGDLTACLVREDGSTGVHGVFQSYTIGAANKRGFYVFLKAAGRTKARVRITNPSGAETSVSVNLATGVVTALGGDFGPLIPLASGWFCIPAYGGAGAGNTGAQFGVILHDAADSESYTGDGASGMYVWGCVATDNQIVLSYWGTGASVNADALDFPFAAVPQAMFLLIDYIDQGLSLGGGGNSFAVEIGNAFQDGRIIIDAGTGSLTAYHQANSASVSSALVGAGVFGDRVRALLILFADGSVQVVKSINLGAESSGAQSGPLAYRSGGWNPQRIQFYGGTTLAEALIACKAGLLTIGGVTRNTIAAAVAA